MVLIPDRQNVKGTGTEIKCTRFKLSIKLGKTPKLFTFTIDTYGYQCECKKLMNKRKNSKKKKSGLTIFLLDQNLFWASPRVTLTFPFDGVERKFIFIGGESLKGWTNEENYRTTIHGYTKHTTNEWFGLDNILNMNRNESWASLIQFKKLEISKQKTQPPKKGYNIAN